MKTTLLRLNIVKGMLALVFFCYTNFSSFAQVTAIFGAGALNGTSSNSATGDPGPMYRSTPTSTFTFSRYNYLYTASEIAAAGITNGSSITSLAWFKDNAAAANSPCVFESWIKNSSLLTIGSGGQQWATLISGATQVYSNSSHMVDTVIGWHEITLNAPFIYTGGALEISTNFDISQGVSPWTTLGFSWKKDNATNVTLSYCGAAAPGLNQPNLRTVRPQLKITYSPFVGIKEQTTLTHFNFTLSPNPSSERVILNLNNCDRGPIKLTLLNAEAQVIYEESIQVETSNLQRSINLTGFSKGLYFLQVSDNSTVKTKKLLIE